MSRDLLRVGDLVTYASRSFDAPRFKELFLGVIIDKDTDGYAGHVTIYWLKHTSYQGETKWMHPSNLRKIEDSS
jgi:hypothetical protein